MRDKHTIVLFRFLIFIFLHSPPQTHISVTVPMMRRMYPISYRIENAAQGRSFQRRGITGIGIPIAYTTGVRDTHRVPEAFFRVGSIQTDFITTLTVETGNRPPYGRRKEEGRLAEGHKR
ncbi:MAG: hypothetical protein M1418_10550 [Deltaproteobacteria bacterium]|nr:hypothetical protein [Deltaproteobacteria bacterium]